MLGGIVHGEGRRRGLARCGELIPEKMCRVFCATPSSLNVMITMEGRG